MPFVIVAVIVQDLSTTGGITVPSLRSEELPSHSITAPKSPLVSRFMSLVIIFGSVILFAVIATATSSDGYFAPHKQISLVPTVVKHNVCALVPSIFCFIKVPSYTMPPISIDTNGLFVFAVHVPVTSPVILPSAESVISCGLLYSKESEFVFLWNNISYVPAISSTVYPLFSTLSVAVYSNGDATR